MLDIQEQLRQLQKLRVHLEQGFRNLASDYSFETVHDQNQVILHIEKYHAISVTVSIQMRDQKRVVITMTSRTPHEPDQISQDHVSVDKDFKHNILDVIRRKLHKLGVKSHETIPLSNSIYNNEVSKLVSHPRI